MSDINLIDNFFLSQDEPQGSCLLALRSIFMNWDDDISEHWKYSIPFYYYKGKPFCYLWRDKKTLHPYIGIVKGGEISHPELYQGSRKKMKILQIDPNEDIPIKAIYEIFEALKPYY
tara:strand:+ start:111313 stop:111663 length:351 start_codon:yes stop_codon:yes gene_type:complete